MRNILIKKRQNLNNNLSLKGVLIISLFTFNLSMKAVTIACSGHQQITADYLQKFAEFEQATTSKLGVWSNTFAALYSAVLPWEGQLVRVPSGQFDNLQSVVLEMQTESQSWSDLSLKLDDLSYSLEELVSQCEGDMTSWLERYSAMASEQRLLENQMVSYLNSSSEQLQIPLNTWLAWQGVELVVPQDSFLELNRVSQNHMLVGREYLPDFFKEHLAAFKALIDELELIYGEGRKN